RCALSTTARAAHPRHAAAPAALRRDQRRARFHPSLVRVAANRGRARRRSQRTCAVAREADVSERLGVSDLRVEQGDLRLQALAARRGLSEPKSEIGLEAIAITL